MPVREFRWARGQKHLPGLWWSATTGAHVGYESWLERDHVMLLDFDPQVTMLVAQPFWLRWRDGAGRSRRHAPDLFARMADGCGVVIDVRPDDRIEQRDAEAFGVTKDACGLAGWGFRRVGVPDPVLAANVSWLARYRHPRCGGWPGLARRDRGSNYTAAFDAVLAGAGIRTVLCNVRTPRMNAIAERWIGGCRRELLDRTLIWNQNHLRRTLRQYETHHNQHRPHRSLHSAAPLKPLPQPVILGQHRVRRQTRAGGTINEYGLVA